MGGLQYHRKKDECGVIISGKLKVRYDNGQGKLKSKILKKIQSKQKNRRAVSCSIHAMRSSRAASPARPQSKEIRKEAC